MFGLVGVERLWHGKVVRAFCVLDLMEFFAEPIAPASGAEAKKTSFAFARTPRRSVSETI